MPQRDDPRNCTLKQWLARRGTRTGAYTYNGVTYTDMNEVEWATRQQRLAQTHPTLNPPPNQDNQPGNSTHRKEPTECASPPQSRAQSSHSP